MEDVNLDDEVLALRKQQSKKRKLMAIVGLSVALLAGVGVTLAVVRASAENEAKRKDAWNQASSCVVGEPVEGPDEASSAFRNGQLYAMGFPPEKRSEPGQKAWPERCASPLHGLAEVLEGDDDASALAASATKLADALEQPDSHSKGAWELVRRVWEDARALGLQASPVEGPKPPGMASPLTQDSLPESAKFLPKMVSLDALKTESTPSGRMMFLVDAKDQPNLPALCTVQADKKQIVCKVLPENLKRVCPGLALFGTSEESVAPFVFAGDRGKAGIYRSTDGTQVAQGLSYGASALADGSLVRTVWNEDHKQVWYAIHPPNGKAKETKLLDYDEVGNPYYNSGLFWDWLVYKAWVKDEISLLSRKVTASGELEAIQRVGELGQRSLVVPGETRPHITACRTKQALVVRVKGTNEQYTAFHLSDGWKPPVASRGTDGDLTCSETEAVITHLVPQMPEPWVYQTRCTAATCQRSELSFKQMLRDVSDLKPQDKQHLTAAELDGKLLVLWGAGERGGLRMRFAPMDRIVKVPDQVVFDDLVQGGKEVPVPTLVATRLLSGSKFALLFLSTIEGIYVLYVDGKGALTPMKTVFERNDAGGKAQ